VSGLVTNDKVFADPSFFQHRFHIGWRQQEYLTIIVVSSEKGRLDIPAH
jgi:hypothetical protein